MKIGIDWGGTKIEGVVIDSDTGEEIRRIRLDSPKENYEEIDSYCKKVGIEWFASAWDLNSQEFLNQFNCKNNKIASALIVYEDLLRLVAKQKKHTFISTGMSKMKDIAEAVKVFRSHSCPFELLHSHSAYPMDAQEANLKVIQTLQKKFKCNVGYSGHEVGSYLVPVIAVTLGATTIERHITLNRAMYGSDQSASLEKSGLNRMVRDIRLIEDILD